MPITEVPKPEKLPDEKQVATWVSKLLIIGPIGLIIIILLSLLLPHVNGK